MSDVTIGYGSSTDPTLPPINLPSFGDKPPRTIPNVVINAPPRGAAADEFPVYGKTAAVDPNASAANEFPDFTGKPAEALPPKEASTDSMQRLLIDYNNQQQAAAQRTSPYINDTRNLNLLGPATEDELGNVGYKDPQGNFVPTDQNKHVVLTDPNDAIPKVFMRTPNTDEGALLSTGRMLGTMMGTGAIELGKSAPVAVQAAQRLGVDLPRAIATNNPIVKFTGQVLSKAPGGSPVNEAVSSSLEQLGNAVQKGAELAGGDVNPAVAGESFTKGITDFFKPGVKAAKTDAYDRVAQLVDQNKLTPLNRTAAVAQDILSRRSAAELGDSKAVQNVLSAVTNPKGLTFNGIKDLRTSIGEMLDTGVFPEGMSQAELRRIYGSLSDDLYAAATNAGGPRAAQALAKANELNKGFEQWKDAIEKIVGPQSRSNEGVYGAIVRMAGTGATADIKTLRAARAAVPAEAWKNVASTAISTLGKNRTGEWSPAAFLSQYRNLSDEGKRILFGGVGSGNVIPFLNDIANVSDKFVQAGKLANTSGTAGHNAALVAGGAVLTGLAHGSFIEPISALGGLMGINVMARVLSTPATAASLARWSNAYLRVAQNPGPAGIAALGRVTRELTATINGSLGTKLDPAQLMRAVNAPSEADANKYQDRAPGLPPQ